MLRACQFLVIGGLLLQAGLLSAQIYQEVDENGNPLPVFTDRPTATSRKTVMVDQGPVNSASTTSVEQAEAYTDNLKKDEAIRDTEISRLELQLTSALDDLQRTESELATGKEPGEGDRIGTAGGNSRFRPSYHERVARLEKRVDNSKQRVAELEDELRALRKRR